MLSNYQHALDEVEEQKNALIKGTGLSVGLTESPDFLLRWMVCGPGLLMSL